VIHRGRTTIVVDVKVTDDQQRLVASMVATLLAPIAHVSA
jgi:acyl-coenzyme A thioesterase PaaI-like protein